MTEKRFTTDNGSNEDVTLVDNVTGKEYESNFDEIVDLLNEQHETIKEVHDLLVEEVDLFSDKATEHDINAYVELKEFDNKDAYYMATATKKAIKMLRELI